MSTPNLEKSGEEPPEQDLEWVTTVSDSMAYYTIICDMTDSKKTFSIKLLQRQNVTSNKESVTCDVK